MSADRTVELHFLFLELCSPASYVTPRAAALTRYLISFNHETFSKFSSRLYTDLVNDALTEFAYDADLAGLSYHFSDTTTGLYVFAGGYNDNLATLIRVVMQKARELEAKPDRLAVMKEQVVTYRVNE